MNRRQAVTVCYFSGFGESLIYLSSDLTVYSVVTYFHIVNKYFEFDFCISV